MSAHVETKISTFLKFILFFFCSIVVYSRLSSFDAHKILDSDFRRHLREWAVPLVQLCDMDLYDMHDVNCDDGK